MNKIFLLLIVLSSFAFSDLSVNQIRDMVMKIHQKREGISLDKLDMTKEPFMREHVDINTTKVIAPEEYTEKAKLTLHAILNNRAYINEAWNKVNDSIGGYILKYIGKRGVVLQNENEIKKLFIGQKNDNFIIIKEKE